MSRFLTFMTFCALVIAACDVLALAGLRWNTTESEPRGLWWSASIGEHVEAGEYVAVCLPATPVVLLYVGPGDCQNGLKPLLKTIGAVAGDTVELSAEGVRVNGLLLQNTAPLEHDDFGRPLIAWPFGTYHIQPGEVWLLSTYSPRAFDSRYFGPVDVHSIVARGVPLFVR